MASPKNKGVFRFRLEAKNGHFRQGAISAKSKEEAKETLLGREQSAVDYRLDTAELALCKAIVDGRAEDKFITVSAARSKLVTHDQDAQYKLVKLEEVK